MPLTKTIQIYTYAELKALDDRPRTEQDDQIDSGALERVNDWLRQGQFEYEWWRDSVEGDITELFKACGITWSKPDVTFDLDRGSYFALPRDVRVDERAFLAALKWYLVGKDIRTLPALQWGGDELKRRPFAAIGTQIRNFDLRSKDARRIRDAGLSIEARFFGGGRTATNEFDFHSYDEISEQTMTDANELLSDLHEEALRLLRAEMEYREGDEQLAELAEANEYTFDREGRPASA